MSHPKCAATPEVLRSIKNRPSKSSRRPPGGRRDSRRRRAACRRSTAPACGPVPAPPDRPRIPPTAAGTSPRRSRPRSPATGLSFSRPPPAPPPPRRTTGCCCAPRRRGAWTLPRRSSSAPWLLYCTGVSHSSHQARTDAPAASQSPRLSPSPSPVVRRRRRRLCSGGWSAGWWPGGWLVECGSTANLGRMRQWRVEKQDKAQGRGREDGRTEGGRECGAVVACFRPLALCIGHGETGVFWEAHAAVRRNWRHPERQRRRRTVATGAGERRALPYARLDPAVGRRPATLVRSGIGGRGCTRRLTRPEESDRLTDSPFR
jgi:hypothetical protein